MVRIEISNKAAYTIIAVVILLIAAGIVYAYHSGSQPSVFGHSAEELEVNVGGQVMTLQQAIDDGSLGGGFLDVSYHDTTSSSFTCPGGKKVLSCWSYINPGGSPVCGVDIQNNGTTCTRHSGCSGSYNMEIICGKILASTSGGGITFIEDSFTTAHDTAERWTSCARHVNENKPDGYAICILTRAELSGTLYCYRTCFR
jgi:hypothetical protein